MLAGWDSDNPAATWRGLLGFMEDRAGIEALLDRDFSQRYNIHRTQAGFPVPNGVDNFMAWLTPEFQSLTAWWWKNLKAAFWTRAGRFRQPLGGDLLTARDTFPSPLLLG